MSKLNYVKVDGLEELLETAVKEQGFRSLEDYFERGKALENLMYKNAKKQSIGYQNIYHRLEKDELELFYLSRLADELSNERLQALIKPLLKPQNLTDKKELIKHFIELKGYSVSSYCRKMASKTGLNWKALKEQLCGENRLSLSASKKIAEDLEMPPEYVQRLLIPPSTDSMKELVKHYIELNAGNITNYCKRITKKTKTRWDALKSQIVGKNDLSLFNFKTIAEDLQIPQEYARKFLLPPLTEDKRELIKHYMYLKGYGFQDYWKRIAPKTGMSWGGLQQQMSGRIELSLFNFKVMAEDLQIPEEYTNKFLLPKITDDKNELIKHYITINGQTITRYCKQIAPKTGMRWTGLQQQISKITELSLFNFKTIAEDLQIPQEYTNKFLIRTQSFKNLKEMIYWYANLNTSHSSNEIHSLVAEKTSTKRQYIYDCVKIGRFPNNEILYQLVKAVNAPYDIVKQVTGFDAEQYEKIKAKEPECFKELKRKI